MILRKLTTSRIEESLKKLNSIQMNIEIQMPHLYVAFVTSYAVGQYYEKWESKIDKFLRLKSIVEVVFKRKEILFPYGWLFSPEELELDLKYYSEKDFLLDKYGVIRIGNIVSGGGLYLGVTDINRDAIYKLVWDHDLNPIKIADSIFDFMNSLEIMLLEKDLQKDIGQQFYFDKEFELKLRDECEAEIVIVSKKKDHLLSEGEFILSLKKIYSDVRDKNYGSSS